MLQKLLHILGWNSC